MPAPPPSSVLTSAPERHAGWVRLATVLAMTGYSTVASVHIVTGQVVWTQLVALAVLLGALVLHLNDRNRIAGWVLTLTVWLEAMVSLVHAEHGLASSPMMIIMLVLVGAGLLLGRRGTLWLGLATAAGAPLLVTLGGQLGIGPGLHTDNAPTVAVSELAVLGVTTLLVQYLSSFEAVLSALKEQATEMRRLVEDAPDGLVEIDATGRVRSSNQRARELLGTSEALVGLQVRQLPLDPVDATLLNEFLTGSRDARIAAALDQESLELRSASGARLLEVRVQNTAGGTHRLLVFRDVTETRAIEAQAVSLRHQLQHAQKLEAVGRLAGGVAHDFNNILMVVGGTADLLFESSDTDTREAASDLQEAAERGRDLTRQLLTFARRDDANPQLLDLGQNLRGAERLLQRLLGERINLVLDLPDRRLAIVADPGQINQVIMNLAANARDAMPEGGTFTVRARQEASDRIVCSVADTGVGMDEATRHRIFEPFFTTKGVDRGTGLGLATVHGILSGQGANLEVHSQLGVGTTFEIAWPSAASQSIADEDTEDPSTVPMLGGRVLLVEDQAQTLATVRRMLEFLGLEPIPATSMAEAHAILKSDLPDLILTDVRLPDGLGTDLASAFGQRVPVILMSGYIGDDLIGSTPANLLAKPFNLEDLAVTLRRHLAPQRRGRGATHLTAP